MCLTEIQDGRQLPLKNRKILIYSLKTRIPSGIWSCLYGWTVHGLYKSYTGLEARVESRSANHRPSRLGHVGATTDCNWTAIGPPTHFFVTDRQKRDYLSRASQHARGATNERFLQSMAS